MFKKAKTIRWTVVLLVLVLMAGLIIAFAERVWPSAEGKKVAQDLPLTVDWSHADDGYIMIKCTASDKRYKVRIKYGDTVMTYDYNGNGSYEVFPLQYGSGSYTVILYKQVSGKKYSEEGRATIQANMRDEMAAFLTPNQYVNYSESSAAVQKADELCAGLTDEKAIYDEITSYVTHNFVYDFIKSVTVQSGEMPDISGTFSSKKGICQDLAAMTVCMLRSQGVHAKLMVGYADKNYHAWVVVSINGKEYLYDPTAEVGGISKSVQYSVERFY